MHRDISLGNVFVAADFTLKLGDLGISHVLGGNSGESAAHLAPELWRQQGFAPPTDCWALGCLFHQLLTTKPPFSGRTVHELRGRVLLGRYPRLPASCSADAAAVVARLLTPDPARRWTCLLYTSPSPRD